MKIKKLCSAPPHFIKIKFLFLIFLNYCSLNKAESQQLLTEIPTNLVVLSSTDTIRWQTVKDTNYSKNVKVVSIGNIDTLSTDSLYFQIPGKSSHYIAVAGLASEQGGYFTWYGKIVNAAGHITLIVKNHITAGYIQIENDFYEIMPIDSLKGFMVERNMSLFPRCEGPVTVENHHNYTLNCTVPEGFSDTNNCSALISILMVVTSNAETWILSHYGSVDWYTVLCQATINQALFYSGIPNKEVRISWVLDENDIQDNKLSFNLDVEIDRSILPNSDVLGDLRDENKADIAVLITNQGYTDAAAASTNFGPDSSTAFALAEAPFVVSFYTLAHEWGHLLGCHHNWDINLGDDDTTICAHAKRLIPTPTGVHYGDEFHLSQDTYHVSTWRTIVGIPLPLGLEPVYNVFDNTGWYGAKFDADPVIPYFSNPNIYYGGAPTGVAISEYGAYNALFIQNNACEVAGFWPTQELNVFINNSVCSDLPFDFNADIIEPESGLPGVGPYTVDWFWSDTSIFPTGSLLWDYHFLGTGNTLSISTHPVCTGYWVKCVVISSDDVVVSRIKYIDLSNSHCRCSEHKTTSISNVVSDNEINAYPNPYIGNTVTLKGILAAREKLDVIILDISGREVFRDKMLTFNNEGLTVIHPGLLPEGIYIIRIFNINTGFSQNCKLAVAQN